MGAYSQGGGGGRASKFVENPADALSKPYDLDGPITSETLQQINEMFELLFKSNTKRRDETVAVKLAAASVGTLALAQAIIPITVFNSTSNYYQLVAAPGVGKIHIPVMWTVESDTTTVGGVGGAVELTYGTGFSGFSMCGTKSLDANNIRTKYTSGTNEARNFLSYSGAVDPRNKPLAVHATASNATSGGVGNVNISVVYYTITSVSTQ